MVILSQPSLGQKCYKLLALTAFENSLLHNQNHDGLLKISNSISVWQNHDVTEILLKTRKILNPVNNWLVFFCPLILLYRNQ
jgi:hypothetical protein